MALGLSKMFGVDLPLNFDSPYRAASLVDFWRRWHMSLSALPARLRLHPARRQPRRPRRDPRNLAVTLLLGGLWHGIGWTFLAWGAIHGALLAVNHAWRAARPRPPATGWRLAASVAATFLVVTLAWVPFRADTLQTAGAMFASLFGANGIALPRSWSSWAPDLPWGSLGIAFEGTFRSAAFDGPRAIATLVALSAIVWLAPNACRVTGIGAPREPRYGWKPTLGWALAAGALLALSALRLARPSVFLYYQF